MTAGHLRVLCAPACRHWRQEPASEDGWLPTVFRALVELDGRARVTAVVEVADVASSPAIRIVAVGRRRHELAGSATLPAKVAVAVARGRLFEAADVLHVGLPFAIGRTQSAVAAMARLRSLPLVVGPLQAPQTWLGADERASREQLITAAPAAGGAPSARLVDRTISAVAAGAGPLLRAANRRLLRSADLVVAVDAAAAALVRAAGVEPGRIRIIPPPLSSPVSGASRPKNTTRSSLLTAGFLIERKAVDKILLALRAVRDSGIPAVLVVAGRGPQEAALRRLTAELRLEDAVEFVGWLDKVELVEAMAEATVYVAMSRSESFGVSLADAMASGLPVVSAANGGARSLVEPGVTGWLVPVDDNRALADRLRQLLADREAAASMGARASQWAREHLAPPVVAEGWLAAYRDAIALHEDRAGGSRRARRQARGWSNASGVLDGTAAER